MVKNENVLVNLYSEPPSSWKYAIAQSIQNKRCLPLNSNSTNVYYKDTVFQRMNGEMMRNRGEEKEGVLLQVQFVRNNWRPLETIGEH